MAVQYTILKDITISNQDTTGRVMHVSFEEGEVVAADAYLLPQIENLVAKGLAKRYEAPTEPADTTGEEE